MIMNNKRKSLSLLLSLITLAAPAFATNSGLQSQTVSTSSSTVLQGEVVSVQAGANVQGSIDRQFSSSASRVGDRGYFTLNQGLNSNVPAGSVVEFQVTSVRSAKRLRFESPGELQLKALNIRYPDGRTARLSGDAYIVSSPSEVVLTGATKGERVKQTAKKTAIGAGGGALAGLVGGAISGGRLGKGAAIGTAIGAGVGAGSALISKGDEILVGPNDRLFLKFAKSSQIVPN
jgi:hypothetical protein